MARQSTADRRTSKFAEIGRIAADQAQRKILLETCRAVEWNLTMAAEALGLSDASAVIRALKRLAPKEYAAAKKSEAVAPGPHRDT